MDLARYQKKERWGTNKDNRNATNEDTDAQTDNRIRRTALDDVMQLCHVMQIPITKTSLFKYTENFLGGGGRG